MKVINGDIVTINNSSEEYVSDDVLGASMKVLDFYVHMTQTGEEELKEVRMDAIAVFYRNLFENTISNNDRFVVLRGIEFHRGLDLANLRDMIGTISKVEFSDEELIRTGKLLGLELKVSELELTVKSGYHMLLIKVSEDPKGCFRKKEVTISEI